MEDEASRTEACAEDDPSNDVDSDLAETPEERAKLVV